MRSQAQIDAEARAHVTAQERLQLLAAAGVARAWDGLPNYDVESVPSFLLLVVPFVIAAQRQSAMLVNAFLARAGGRQPLPLDLSEVTGAAIRRATQPVIEASQAHPDGLPEDAKGVPPRITYRRPFVTTWSALADHHPYVDAVAMGRDRAQGTAAMDVQNAMRHTLIAVGEQDDLILGYQRVPDSDPCAFCALIAGRRYLKSDLQPVHENCACSVAPIYESNRGDFTGKPENDLRISRDGVTAAVVEHGELGPLLVDGNDAFHQIAA